jgi:hypothetical protein
MEPQVTVIRNRIVDEIFFALGLGRSGGWRRALGPLFYLPANHLAHIGAILEEEAPRSGLSGASQRALPDLSLNITTHGVERVPQEGPVLIVSNHPGAYDSVVVTASIPRRDLKLLVSDVGFTHALEACSQDFIFVSTDPTERMAALRASITHLRRGGALLIFPNGEVEPDPAIMPGAEKTIAGWSPSIEIMLRKVPDCWLQLVIASGMLLPKFVHSPLTRIRRMPFHRQKMGELLQILQQMLFPHSIQLNPRVSFAQPVCAGELPPGGIMPDVVRRARRLLEEHVARFESGQKAARTLR